jgi:hypothetical protein
VTHKQPLLEGVMMIAVYAMLGVGFFFLPGPRPGQ